MATSDAPVSIGQVTLVVRDLKKTARFYQDVIGLESLHQDGESAQLGVNGTSLIALRRDRYAQTHPNEAGLFHTAFLLPSEQDLGAWLQHAINRGIQLDGASHHGVSQALYLEDPEGNGIEIYRDLPPDSWHRSGDTIQMTTARLDLAALLQQASPWQGAPSGTVIGHVHLRVGDVTEAAAFITQNLGIVQTFQHPGGRWYGSGGYHHHLASNQWHSAGAGQRSAGSAGLVQVELHASADAVQQGAITPGILHDPWGTEFLITQT